MVKKTDQNSFNVLEKLAKTCTSCKQSTLKTYARNLRRLAKMSGHDNVPSTKGWLFGAKGKDLIKQVSKLPLTSARHLYTAGSQGARIYNEGERSSMWVIAMNDASHKYDEFRKKRTHPGIKNWPKGGYKILSKSASSMKRKLGPLLKKTEYTQEEQYEVQKYVIMLLYSHHAFRTEPATWTLKKSDTENTLLRPRGSRRWIVTNRTHKTSKTMGTVKITLSPAVSNVLSKYIPKLKTPYFLSTKTGGKLSQAALSKLILRITKATVGSAVGVRLGRVLKATASAKTILAAHKLAKEMGHSAKTQLTYIKD